MLFFVVMCAVGFVLVRGMAKDRLNVPGRTPTLIIAGIVLAVSLGASLSGGHFPPVAIVVSNIALIAIWLPNRRNTGLCAGAAGGLMNFAVITANGGRMPVFMQALPAQTVLPSSYAPLNEGTHLALLCDHIIVHTGLGNALVSPGDLIALAGLLLFTLFTGTQLVAQHKDP